MIPTQLSIYNGALRRLGERKLSTVTDNVPNRHHLDTIWDEDPIKTMLEKYDWTFARKTLEWNYNAAIDPDFGYQFAFDVPSDYIRLSSISADEYFTNPLRGYQKEGEVFYCEYQTIYLMYVSDDVSYGRDYSKWTTLFSNMLATYIAWQLAPGLQKSKAKRKELFEELDEYEGQAKSVDGQENPTRFLPQSSWARSRRGGSSKDSNRGAVFG